VLSQTSAKGVQGGKGWPGQLPKVRPGSVQKRSALKAHAVLSHASVKAGQGGNGWSGKLSRIRHSTPQKRSALLQPDVRKPMHGGSDTVVWPGKLPRVLRLYK